MPRNIVLLGLVSLLTDISTEMIYPLVPIYLTAVLGASPAALGLIEGFAESLASLLKLVSGGLADRFAWRKPLAIAGYGFSAVGKILFVFAGSWFGILAARLADRFGKGVRTAPRDSLIAEAAGETGRGKSFGFHRFMDTLGAVGGIILAYLLFISYQGAYKTVFWLSIIPAAMGVAVLFLVREQNAKEVLVADKQKFAFSRLDNRLKAYLLIAFIFNLGNSSNAFLLLKAGNLGLGQSQVILLYLLMNVSYLVLSYPAGVLSDRLGRKKLLTVGYLLYAVVYFGFARVDSMAGVIMLFVLYGLYMGLTEGVEKALLADLAPKYSRASVYGLHAMVVGIALLPASLIAGLLWDWLGASAPFIFGGGMGLIAALAVANLKLTKKLS